MEIDKICCFQYWHNWNFDTTLAKPLDVLSFTKHNDDEGNEKAADDDNYLYDLKKRKNITVIALFFFGGWGKYEMNKTQIYKTKYWQLIIWRHCSLDGCRNSCHGHGDCNVDQDGEYSCQCRFCLSSCHFVIMSSFPSFQHCYGWTDKQTHIIRTYRYSSQTNII